MAIHPNREPSLPGDPSETMNALRSWLAAAVPGLLVALGPADAHAYIGPGAGFALGGSMLVLLVTFLLAATFFTPRGT